MGKAYKVRLNWGTFAEFKFKEGGVVGKTEQGMKRKQCYKCKIP